MHIKIASRDSALAVAQSQLVLDAIKKHHPNISLELLTMKTKGDRILDKTLDKVGGKGLFVQELEVSMEAGSAHLAIHSCKDLPMEINPHLPLVAFFQRGDPRDCLVLPEGMDQPDFTKPIGTSSQRRALELSHIFPGIPVSPVRGNLITRLKKLDSGQFSALILAVSGLERLNLSHRISRYFSTDEMLPAGGQGILAVQGVLGRNYDFLEDINCPRTQACAQAERAFVATLDGGCSSPVAAFCEISDNKLILCGMDTSGNKDSLEGEISEPVSLGVTLGKRMKGACV